MRQQAPDARASFGGDSELWTRKRCLEAKASSGRESDVSRRKRALEEAASSRGTVVSFGGSKLWQVRAAPRFPEIVRVFVE